MVLKLEDKKAIVSEVAIIASESVSAGVADYRGLTVAEMTALRTKARDSEVYIKVVRNTLASRAVENTDFACLKEVFSGPVLLAFSKNDPGAVARLFRGFIKECDKLMICGLSLGGRLLSPRDIDTVAELPTRDRALSILLVTMKAPITQLARTMAEPYAMLVRSISAVGSKKSA